MVRTMLGVAVAVVMAMPGQVVAQDTPAGDLVDVAAAAGSFGTLLQAVRAAGLEDVLRGPGPFTVFAPTDEAFAKLPAGALEALLADREQLAAVLTYHVVAGRVMAEQVVASGELAPATVQGERLTIRVRNGTVYVDGAAVVAADIEATNGVIHVIDSVVLPGNGGK
jgi:uncharacterized surface protein with fasciclin (FAS1) repeats